jgi:DNA-binding transcriptional MerR regulator
MVIGEERAAKELGVSPRTLQRWRVEGKGPAFRKLGKLVAYTREDLLEFITRARRTSTSQAEAGR